MALDNSTVESRSISRRTIIKGAAWSAPVMIAAVAVPAAVASSPVTTVTPSAVTFTGSGLQTKTFTLTPTPATGGTITVLASGPFQFANGTKSTSATVADGGVISVDILPTAEGTGSLSLSGKSSGVSWGPKTVQLTAHPTAALPSPLVFSGGNAELKTITLTPTPVSGTVVNLSISGTGYAFNTNNGPTTLSNVAVAANGTLQFTARAGNGAGQLVISNAGWASISLPLQR